MSEKIMKVGVFDSGVGGQSVVNAIRRDIPDLEICFKDDRKNLPYGRKNPEELLTLVDPIMQEFIDEGCRVVVIACNTVTTTIIGELRRRFDIPFVGLEPMIKPASEKTKSRKVIVCATPGTLNSSRYGLLKSEYGSGVIFIEPDCSEWASLIEENRINRSKIEAVIMPGLENGADVVVLGCTHYHWIESDISDIAKKFKALVIQPEQAVTEQLKRVLEQLD